MKVKNRLLDSDYIIYQDDEWFKFSLDSVLLANFVTIHLGAKKILDLATGNAPIPMLLTFRTNAKIYGVEYQEGVYELACQSVLENHLDDRVMLFRDDVRCLNQSFQGDSFDVITCNPPYFKVNNHSFINDNSIKTIARHEVSLTLDDVVRQASFLLKNRGIFAMVHRTERLVEVFDVFRKYGIEPKRIRFIYPKVGMNSDLFLIEGIKGGKSGIKMIAPLVIHCDDNSYTDEVREMLSFR